MEFWAAIVLDFAEVARAGDALVQRSGQQSAVFGAGKVRVCVSTPLTQTSKAARYLKVHPAGVMSLSFTVDDLDKTADFLEKHKVSIDTQVNAKKTILANPEALGLLSQVDELYATKGTKVIHVNLKTARPDDETLLSLVIGPSGKLRAPTLKKGRTLIVGFDEATYQHVFV